jgi:23S rRNA pseudouridine2605 synthase
MNMTDISRVSEQDVYGRPTGVRLQAYLARAGVASRRACETLITDGRVSVNGLTAAVLGTRVNEGDAVCVDGKQVFAENRLHYVLLNKPSEYICAASDPQRSYVRELRSYAEELRSYTRELRSYTRDGI